MANYNSYDVLAELAKKNQKVKRAEFSPVDPHNQIKQHFLICFNAIDIKLKIIEGLVNKLVKKFNV